MAATGSRQPGDSVAQPWEELQSDDSVSLFLDNVRQGYGDRFRETFDEFGLKLVEDLKNASVEKLDELEEGLDQADAGPAHIERMREAIDELRGEDGAKRDLTEGEQNVARNLGVQASEVALQVDEQALGRVKQRNDAMVAKQNLKTLADISELDYRELGWGDAEAAAVAEVLRSGAMPRLRQLYLSLNALGPEGAEALAGVLASGTARRLQALYLRDNAVGDAGAAALAGVLASGRAPALEVLALENNGVGDAGAQALATAISSGQAAALWRISLWGNRVGPEAKRALVAAGRARGVKVDL